MIDPSPRAPPAAPPVVRFPVVVLAALLVRLLFVWLEVRPLDWRAPAVAHGSELGSIARNLAEGRGFSSPFGPGEEPSAWLGPLVPGLWAAVFRALGVLSHASLVAVFALQCLAAALACGCHAVLWRRIAAQLGPVSPNYSRLVVGLLVIWPASLAILRRPWVDAYQELAVAAFLVVATTPMGRSAVGRGFLLGLLAAITCTINPVPALFLGAVFVRQFRLQPRWNGRAAMVALATLLVGLAPWAYRSTRALGGLVVVRSNLGVEVYLGNNEHGSITQTRDSIHPALQAEELERFHALGELEYSNQALAQALAYMREHPARTAGRVLQRFYRYWCTDLLDQWPWTPDTPWYQKGPVAWIRRLGKVAFHFLPLAVILLSLARGARRPPFGAVFLAAFVLLPLPYYATHVADSYRNPVIPFLLLTAATLYWMARRARQAA